MSLLAPSKDQALQFAIMLKAGVPPSTAIRYFVESEDPQELAQALLKWTASKSLAAAQVELLGAPWQEMTSEQQIRTALDYTYAGMAYFLFSTNYAEMASGDKAKADTARQALEAKLAGVAGKDPLSRFLEDFTAGKLKSGATGVTR